MLSVGRSMFRHFASSFRDAPPVQCAAGVSPTKAPLQGLGSALQWVFVCWGLHRSGVDLPLSSSRTCLHTAFIAIFISTAWGGGGGCGLCRGYGGARRGLGAAQRVVQLHGEAEGHATGAHGRCTSHNPPFGLPWDRQQCQAASIGLTRGTFKLHTCPCAHLHPWATARAHAPT